MAKKPKGVDPSEFTETFIDKDIGPLSMEYDQIHGASVNIARHIIDVIDGLKPVQRRALYTMYLKDKGTKFRKLASIGGDTLARFHPHSPGSVEDAVVHMGQEWNTGVCLVEPHGNFGAKSSPRAGASRYIKGKLSDFAQACFFEDYGDSVVDYVMAYDEETPEPKYLPAKYPNALVNGCMGVGYGLSSQIPSYNLREVLEATMKLLDDPNAPMILIPDSPTGADIIEGDFGQITEMGRGSYTMRCTYEVDPAENSITITSLPRLIYSDDIRKKIVDIKQAGGLPELVSMNDMSGKDIQIELMIRDDVNPYKFMRKLVKAVAGLERSYPVTMTAIKDMEVYDYSVRTLLLEWIKWRREQVRTVISHKRTKLLAEERTNDVKIFVMNGDNLEDTINIVRSSHNRTEIEQRLIQRYHDTEIKMDSLQAKVLSGMKMYEFSIDSYNACLKRREELREELKEVNEILNTENGVDGVIRDQLRDGIKRFGTPRKSKLVPRKISIKNHIDGSCILQVTSDGNITRVPASNIQEEPIPIDQNGFALLVDNDSAFIVVDHSGHHTFIKVNDIPLEAEVPLNRFAKGSVDGNIVAVLPYEIDSPKNVTLISKNGNIKRMKIGDIGASKKPLMALEKGDRIVRGVVTNNNSKKDLLIYTKDGMGQRLDPNSIRVTSPTAKGMNGFKLQPEDEIIGCYTIDTGENGYLLYVTSKGKMRLNQIDYLPVRDSKHDSMVKLIPMTSRDQLVSILGCNRADKVRVFYDNGNDEVIDIEKIPITTMSSAPRKTTEKQNAVNTNIMKAKIE